MINEKFICVNGFKIERNCISKLLEILMGCYWEKDYLKGYEGKIFILVLLYRTFFLMKPSFEELDMQIARVLTNPHFEEGATYSPFH